MNKFMMLAIKEAQKGIPQMKKDICEEVDRKECLMLYDEHRKIKGKKAY